MRFGIWALVHGSRGALQDPEEPYDASWERNLALVQEAERLGFDSTLVRNTPSTRITPRTTNSKPGPHPPPWQQRPVVSKL